MTMQQAANVLGVSLNTAYNLARENKMPVVRLGRTTLRVDPDALETWIRAGGSASSKRPDDRGVPR